MDMGGYFWMFVKSFNPNQYEKVLQHPLRVFFAFMGLVLISALIIFTLLIVPLTYQYVASLPARTAGVEQFDLGATVSAQQPVLVLERPHIVLDMGANGTRTGDITLTGEGILYRKYLLFGNGEVRWDEITDLKNQTTTRDRMLGIMILFLLPSIIFWFFIYSTFKAAILFGLLVLLGYTAPRVFRHEIAGSAVVKLGLLTLPSFIIMDFALYPLASVLFWWGLAITTALFFVGVALISDVADDHETRHRQGKV